MVRRVVWMIVILVSMVVALGGCGNGKSEVSKDHLIYALQADAVTLDPQMANDSQSTNVVAQKVYETLVAVDQDGEITPMLAIEWKQVDPLTLEFTLRKDVVFHDGTPFNAYGVKATFERILDKEKPKIRRAMFDAVKEVRVVDDYTVQFITEVPFAPLLIHLAHASGSILSPTAIELDKKGEIALAQNPVGTGPLVFSKWIKGEELVYTRNEAYWGEKLKISGLTFVIIPEDTTRMAMVKKGEAQVAEMVPVTEVERISKDTDMQLIRSLSHRVEFIAFNTEQVPFNDVRVREAVSETLDFPGILKGVYSGVGQEEVSNITPTVFGYKKMEPYIRNIDHAKQLMKEAGIAEGVKVRILTPDRKIRMKQAEVIQAQLKEIGIEAEINSVEWGTYIEETRKGNYDINMCGWSNGTGDADFAYSSPFTLEGLKSGNNPSRFIDPKLTVLITAARQEMNIEKRKAIYGEMQEIIRAERPILTTQASESLIAVHKGVEGLWINADGSAIVSQVMLK